MKFILSLSLLGLFSLSAFSQTNQDLENAHWVNSRTVFSNNGFYSYLDWVYELSTSTDDTIINSKTYLKLVGGLNQRNAYAGALRVDSTRWYFCAADSTQEMLLYDFGLKAGDTLTERIYVNERTYIDSLICTQVAYTDFKGVNRKVIFFEAGGGNHLGSSFLYMGSWVDGIGNVKGMLEEFYNNISGYMMDLACFSVNDTVFFMGGSYTSQQTVGCDATFSVEQEGLSQEIKIFPNPSSGNFTLKFPNFHEALVVSIYSLDGRKLHAIEASQPELKLELDLPEGIYLLRYSGASEAGSQVIQIER